MFSKRDFLNSQNNLRKKDVVIKFEWLNPEAQEIIGENILERLKDPSQRSTWGNIRGERAGRVFFETFFFGSLGLLINRAFLKTPFELFRPMYPLSDNINNFLDVGNIGVSAFGRTWMAKIIQKLHQDLVASMKDHGVIQTKFEHGHGIPNGWINPTIIENTHPVFHVKANGDLVFHTPTRMEYARMKFQEKWPGKLGLQPWRWRAYLKKPEAPKPVREWAAQQIRAWAREASGTLDSLKRRPALGYHYLKKRTKSKNWRRT